MKTAVTVLQEMMVKLGEAPEYECISQSGPHHLATFEFRCVARGAVVTAVARSKKEAKQEAARLMLLKLSANGMSVPPPYGAAAPAAAAAGSSAAGSPALAAPAPRSYVALLKELCEQYKLPAPDHVLVGDTGPPHMRQFTVKVFVGQYERLATSTTKKAARQIASEHLYSYLRDNLARVTGDFVEEDALVRAHEKAMERYVEIKDEQVWRPDLGQKVSEYHLGLLTHIDEDKLVKATESLRLSSGESAEQRLKEVADTMGLNVEYSRLETDDGELIVVQLTPASPTLAMAGASRAEAAAAALQYLMRTTLHGTPSALKSLN